MKVNGLFSAIRWTLAGLDNQVKKMDVISENIANADRVPDEKGRVYHRKVVVPAKPKFGRKANFSDALTVKLITRDKNQFGSSIDGDGPIKLKTQQVGATKIEEIKGEKLVYNPNHPRADENGYVHMPNVNVAEEMVDLISTSRTYEANVTVLDAAKKMAKHALSI